LRKLKGKVILWLAYFDASKTRREGRRLPRSICLRSPSLQEIVKAAEVLNLNPQPRSDARFPRCWWAEGGYVIVDKLGSKQETLRKIAEKISEFRRTERGWETFKLKR